MSFLSRLSRNQPEDAIDRIVRNLHRVLNTRKEYGSVMRDFGLGEYEDMWNTPALLDTLMREIADAVRAFEPGIIDPGVRLLGRDKKLWVRFSLTGTVAGEPREFHIDIDSKYRNVVVSAAP